MNRTIAIVLCTCTLSVGVAVLAQSTPSSSSNAQSSSRPVQKAKSLSARNTALPDEGAVTDGVFSERFFNLRYPVPQGWLVKTPEMRQGLAQQDDAVLLLSTFAKAAPSGSEVNASVTITAENLSLYPDVKTADDYFESLAELVKTRGFTVLNPPAEINIAGVTFLRGDFQKQEGDVTTYQASMVALRKGYVLHVSAISGDEEQLTPLLNRVQIFAPPTMKRP